MTLGASTLELSSIGRATCLNTSAHYSPNQISISSEWKKKGKKKRKQRKHENKNPLSSQKLAILSVSARVLKTLALLSQALTQVSPGPEQLQVLQTCGAHVSTLCPRVYSAARKYNSSHLIYHARVYHILIHSHFQRLA